MSTDQSPDTEDRPGREPRRRQLTVVGVAAAVLLAGGGGAYWASSASSGGTDEAGQRAGGKKPPQLALDQAAMSVGGRMDIAPGEPMGPRSYRATGELPSGPDHAAVHKADRPVHKGDLTELAKSLGLKGSPQKKPGRWEITPADAGGSVLTAETGDGSGTWMYMDRGALTGECDKTHPQKPEARHKDLPGTPAHGACAKDASAEATKGEPVSKDRARDAVRPALKALGLEEARLKAGSTMGGARMVTVTPKVDGLPTYGWDSTFMVGSDGKVARGAGNWGKAVKGAAYPVQSADATLDALNKESQKHGGHVAVEPCVPPSGAGERPQTGKGQDGPDVRPGCAKEGGKASGGKANKAEPTKVSGAEFGLSLEQSHGKRILVPAWIYDVEQPSGAGGTKVAHPAVEPEFLKSSGTSSGEGTPGTGVPEPAQPPQSAPAEQPGSGSAAPGPPKDGKDSDAGGGGIGAGSGGDAPSQAIESYKNKGRTLTISFWGGVCDKYRATAEESGQAVKVRVKAKDSDSKKVCVKIAKRQTVEVKLDKALGDRKVLDARDGDKLPRT
ncbi:hypothetical protein [Streptomyces iconiensis]|uniref:Large membrane protein n=1 Tax=Streptomyces iconiensis TaxID=1384038 RepID=A0ABT7A5A4_9ACTN|nr:hypothetical protein [Streptomyces iconiensis]MDJ1136491.1 hypothetical protein [Streptomyces iconiensis]